MMNIVNPYGELEHRVYARTFLRDIVVELKFEAGVRDNSILKRYLQEYFNVTVGDRASSFSYVELTDPNKLLKFVFSEKNARVEVKGVSYKSFADTMLPFVQRLIAYVEQVCAVEHVKSLSVKKNNVWEIKAHDDIRSVYPKALIFTFKRQHISDLLSMKLPEETPFKVSKEAEMDLSDGVLRLKLATEVKDEQQADFMLGLVAEAAVVPVKDVLEAATKLNDVIYAAFHDIVSIDIINLMESNKE